MEIPGEASPCGSDFPQEGEESRSDLLEQGHAEPGERPLERAGSPCLWPRGPPALSALTGALASLCPQMPGGTAFASHVNFSI